jgi:hypothetical protein
VVAAYGAIAGDGVYHAPTLDRGGSTAERVVSSETAHSVMALLETAIVNDKATGRARLTAYASWARPAPPSGRRRTVTTGPTRNCGVADLPSRRIVALVGIAAPRHDMWGGKAAAPVFARLVKRILVK